MSRPAAQADDRSTGPGRFVTPVPLFFRSLTLVRVDPAQRRPHLELAVLAVRRTRAIVGTMRDAALESATALCAAIRRSGSSPTAFRAALLEIRPEERDAWLDLVWGVDALPEDEPLPRGCVPYLPCPVATVLEALDAAGVTTDDVFVDVGAGLGRVVALVHLATGARCIGLELQAPLVQAARAHAASLGLDGVRFDPGDAAELVACNPAGTVFFLYCPFGGARLEQVLDDLERIARTHPIRVCTVGMPALQRPWLVTTATPSVDLAVYRSRVTAV